MSILSKQSLGYNDVVDRVVLQPQRGLPMSVSQTFRSFVIDQLGRAAMGIRAKNMFGGVGIYQGNVFFALLADDRLYLKVDDANRCDFEALGMRPFQPFADRAGTMQYYELPLEILENAAALQPWVDASIAAAERAAVAKKPRKPKSAAERSNHERKTARGS